MHPSLQLYNLAAGVGTLALPAFFLASALNKRLASQRPRLSLQGHLPFTPLAQRGAWLQAVSVGEVQLAKNIANYLWNQGFTQNLTISSSTPQGLKLAQDSLGLEAQVIPFPLDFYWAVHSAAQRIRPKVYVSLETEIWPNLLYALHRQGTKLLMLNGRISQRSFPRYLKIKPLIAACLNLFSCLSMISELDAQRVIALGANPAKVRVDGNAKYGMLANRANGHNRELLGRLNLQGRPLLVAGSVRSGEEAPVLQAFKQVGDTAVLLVAPRHMKRVANWQKAAHALGLETACWSGFTKRLAQVQVVILDEMGQLFDFYGLSTAAFVGASLVNKGGQNPLEAAAWGIPVAFGPHMDDFADACRLLLPQGARQVQNSQDLAVFWRQSLAGQNVGMGQKGQSLVAGLSSAMDKCADLIMKNLQE